MRDDYHGHPEEFWKHVLGTSDLVIRQQFDFLTNIRFWISAYDERYILINVPMQLLAASPKVSKSSMSPSRLYIEWHRPHSDETSSATTTASNNSNSNYGYYDDCYYDYDYDYKYYKHCSNYNNYNCNNQQQQHHHHHHPLLLLLLLLLPLLPLLRLLVLLLPLLLHTTILLLQYNLLVSYAISIAKVVAVSTSWHFQLLTFLQIRCSSLF